MPACSSSCRPAIDVQITVENLRGKPIYRIDIPEGSRKPYCAQKGTYKIRSDGRNVAIDPDMMAALILDRESEQFVSRFRAAADHVVENLEGMEQRLNSTLERVEEVAQRAVDAAEQATQAAGEAVGAAHEAAAAAGDAGGIDW